MSVVNAPGRGGWFASYTGLVALLLAAACDAPATVGASELAVGGGAEAAGDPEAVGIVGDQAIFCSGVLLTDRVVATAAHCLPQSTNIAAWVSVSFGPSLEEADAVVSVLDVRWAPDPETNDIALLLLASPAPDGTAPRPILRELDDSLVGLPVRVLGFGATSPDDTGTRRKFEGVAKLDDLGTYIRLLADEEDTGFTCGGDSGGPGYVTVDDTEYLIGLVKAGIPGCVGPQSLLARFDFVLGTLVDPFVDSTSPGGAGPGERCFYDEQCTTGDCLPTTDLEGFSYCTLPCSQEILCPEPMVCSDDEGLCRFPLPSPGALGTACRLATDCDSRRCILDPVIGATLCSDACLPVDWPCPEGFDCRLTENPDDPEEMACFPPLPADDDGGGCCALGPAAGSSRGCWAPLFALALALLGLRRRRP